MKKIYLVSLSICIALVVSFFGGNTSCAKVQKIKVTSQDFQSKEIIPDIHACEFLGLDKSPQLSFSNTPEDTQSFALIMFDPDAPDKNFVHWIVFNVPVSLASLEQNIPREAILEDGIRQGINGTEQIGYFGPCPPPKETHRYVFKVFALDTVLELEAGANKKQFLKAMRKHILGRGKLVGLFKNNTNL